MNQDDNLQRFTDAQEGDYPIALSEIKAGKKRSHWMWYIFPQVQGLGFSSMSKKYAIRNLQEATSFINHPVLGPRLVAICNALLALDGSDAREVFGSPDDMKLKSSMTLFALVPETNPVFESVLHKYFMGSKDQATLQILDRV